MISMIYGNTATYSPEKRKNDAYHIRCIHYIYFVCELFLREIVLSKLTHIEDPVQNDVTVDEDILHGPCSFTECNSTCGESYEAASLDSSSQFSSCDDETGGVVGYAFSSFYIKSNFPIVSIDIPDVSDNQDRTDTEQITIVSEKKNRIECHGAVTIQRIWRQWRRSQIERNIRNLQVASQIVQNARRQFKEELRASLIILNAWRTWSKENKIRTEVNAAQVVQDAWRLWISKEIIRKRIVTQEKAGFASYKNITYAISVVVLFHWSVRSLH